MLHQLALGRRGAIGALCVAAALLLPAVAQAKTETVTSDGVTASFTYHGSGFSYHGETITIKRHGKVLYSHAVNAGKACGTSCEPAPAGPSLHVLDLEHNGGRDVVLELYSGGAHCCWIAQVFYPSGSTYRKTQRNFGDPGWLLKDLGHNGRLEFVTSNDAFAYQFTSYAGSGRPIQILSFSHGRFHDVTRSYPALISKDAKFWLNTFKQNLSDGEGVIAAWTADEYMLGRKTQAIAYLNKQAKAGHLKSADPTAPSGHKFVLALEKFLTKQGY